MSNPLHAAYYADSACQRTVEVLENVEIARDTFRARFRCREIAERITPGQFLMLRMSGCDDPLIGRPLALYDVVSGANGARDLIDVVYLKKGKFTTHLASAGHEARLDVWGPLGNGFPAPTARHVVMVAGGIGQTPFVALGKEYLGREDYGNRHVTPVDKVTLCYGARSAELLAGVDDFSAAGIEVRIATDDGSRGHHGLVTTLLEEILREEKSDLQIVCCGPEPMMEAVAGIAERSNTPCLVSLETPMACGVGICFTCVAKIRQADQEWDFKRTCVDGPVFDATSVVW